MVDPAGSGGATPASTGSASWRASRAGRGDADPVDCFSADQFIKHVFMDSDTRLAVLSFVPELPENNPLSLEEAEQVRILARWRARIACSSMPPVVPNAGPRSRPAAHEEAAVRYPIAAWKSYTQGPDGVGWELDSPEVGIPFIEQARTLGVHNICIHKGLLFSGFPEEYGRCADVGRAAKLYPDVNFIIYHSGYEAGTEEGPFDPDRRRARRRHAGQVGPRQRHRPERQRLRRVGKRWRFVMRDPTTAAHLLGKLLTHIGEDNVLWGTDSICGRPRTRSRRSAASRSPTS